MTEAKTDARIVVSKNGPYLVSGNVPLAKQIIATDGEGGSESWQEGGSFPLKAKYALCRCGRSGNKPFCDGTHAKVAFDGTETASREPYLSQAKVFDGPALRLTDADALCAFGRFCDPHGGVWREVARTNDPTVRETFLTQVKNCPAGRLVAWDKATGQAIEPELPVSIGVVEDPEEQCSGPLWVRGGISVVSGGGFQYEVRNRATLCRCGHSENKPFCDGTHASIKFRAE